MSNTEHSKEFLDRLDSSAGAYQRPPTPEELWLVYGEELGLDKSDKQGLVDALREEFGEILPEHARVLIAAGYPAEPEA
jgi:hypothetical protein